MEILQNNPFMALFLAVALGYLAGKLKIGNFRLGGIAGTLLAAVLIGQVGLQVDDGIKDIFFALFIYAVGYNGGPEFFGSINRSTLNQVFSAVIMSAAGLIAVVLLAKQFGLNMGLAAGLAAGGLTQSAIIGTAGNAMDMLGLAADAVQKLKVDIAVGYSVTYIFGSLGPILMITAFFPLIYKWNLRQEAVELARKLGGGVRELEEGEYIPLSRADSRVFQVAEGSQAQGLSPEQLEDMLEDDARVEAVLRDHAGLKVDQELRFQNGDLVMLTGLAVVLQRCPEIIGREYEDDDAEFDIVEESRKICITNKKFDRLTLEDLHTMTHGRHVGVFYTALSRMGHRLPLLPGTVVHVGDEITLTGAKSDLDRIEKQIGYKSPSIYATQFMTFGLGMVAGYLLGLVTFHVGDTAVSLGSGLGCLLSGLIFGYLRARHPAFGGISTGAADFLQSFGLAVFVGVIGLNAGAGALETIKEHGISLLYLGAAVTLVPLTLVFFFNYYVLRIKNPVIAMGVLAGSKSANPAFSALLEKTGNSTPVAAFTVTYAVANILLTLWGPVIVALMQ